jgi:2-haloacid dehalogenase
LVCSERSTRSIFGSRSCSPRGARATQALVGGFLDFSGFEYLTFDCYGTLIDWEAGILGALRPVLAAHGVVIPDEDILRLYGECEAGAEAGEYKRYREILEGVVRAFGLRLGFTPSVGEVQSLPLSLEHWPPFPDAVAALRRLHTRYKLAIVSNVDDDLFAGSARLLQVPFDAVVTAQQARSYKPSLNNFRLALERIGRPKEKILHVAQSLYHDVVPTRELGWKNVWVNRRKNRPGPGATKAAEIVPDLEVASLEELAEMAVPR